MRFTLPALISLISFASPSVAAAELEVSLEVPLLRVGDRAEVRLFIRGSEGRPVMVSPRSEGTALEVVRGRLLRSDAVDPEAEPLEIRIPVVAQRVGAAILSVRVDGYRCEARCRAARAELRHALRIEPATDALLTRSGAAPVFASTLAPGSCERTGRLIALRGCPTRSRPSRASSSSKTCTPTGSRVSRRSARRSPIAPAR